MSLFRLIIIGLLIYLVSKFVKNLLNPPKEHSKVEGTPKQESDLNLTNSDIEDADFEELDKE